MSVLSETSPVVRCPGSGSGLTAAVFWVEVLVDGVERVLLLAAVLPGSQHVPHTLMQEGVLTLKHTPDQNTAGFFSQLRTGSGSGSVPQSGPCAAGAAAGRTRSRTSRCLPWSPAAAEPGPRR